MSSWTEGALALIIVVGVGIGLFLFSGQSLGDGSTATSTLTITVDAEAAARGAVLAEGQGCLQCHTDRRAPGLGADLERSGRFDTPPGQW